MSLTTSEMTPADIAAVTGNRNDGFGGDNGWWIIILLLALGRGGFAGGGGMYYGSPATQADLAAGFNNSAVLSSLNDIKMGQAQAINYNNQGFSGLNTALLQGFNGIERGFCDVSRQISDCCCGTQRLIERGFCDTNNTIQNTTRDIIDNANANSRAILDFLTKEKIDTLRAENDSLRLAASQAKQNQYLINELRPCPVPAYITCNPYAASYGYNAGCGCGNGF